MRAVLTALHAERSGVAPRTAARLLLSEESARRGGITLESLWSSLRPRPVAGQRGAEGTALPWVAAGEMTRWLECHLDTHGVSECRSLNAAAALPAKRPQPLGPRHAHLVDDRGRAHDLHPFVIQLGRLPGALVSWPEAGPLSYLALGESVPRRIPWSALSGGVPERFEVLDLLGFGAFGSVLRARDGWLAQEVALKHFQGALAEVSRFVREVRVGQMLRHPGIIRVHDLHVHGDDLFMSQELFASTSLSDALRDSGRFDPPEALDAARQTLEALAHAHERGVVHGDVKPQNLLRDSGGGLKLIDFGLATVATDPAGTVPGAAAGTPGFTAPEVLEGRRADPRSDLFSVGCLLHALVTGRGPFARPSVEQTNSAVLRGAGDLPRLEARAPELVPLVHGWIDRRPARRPSSARVALAQLEAAASTRAFVPMLRRALLEHRKRASSAPSL